MSSAKWYYNINYYAKMEYSKCFCGSAGNKKVTYVGLKYKEWIIVFWRIQL